MPALHLAVLDIEPSTLVGRHQGASWKVTLDLESLRHFWSPEAPSSSLVLRVHEEPKPQHGTKGGRIDMMKDINRRSDFKATITPYLELLLHYSLWLTRNGLDATRLLREALIEASQSFDESLPEQYWNMHLRKIMTRRYLYSNQEHADPLARNDADNIDDSLVRNNPLFPFAAHTDQQQLWQTEGSDADVNYLNAIARLPAVCRSAMILSCLEGFSTKEIADLSGVRPQAIESLLSRGRRFIREEFVLHLFGDDPADVFEERKTESA